MTKDEIQTLIARLLWQHNPINPSGSVEELSSAELAALVVAELEASGAIRIDAP